MMRCIPIPAWLAALYADHERRVIAAPDGSLDNPDVSAVDALVGHQAIGSDEYPAIRVAAIVEEGDVERLLSGGVIMLTVATTQLPVFSLTVIGTQDYR